MSCPKKKKKRIKRKTKKKESVMKSITCEFMNFLQLDWFLQDWKMTMKEVLIHLMRLGTEKKKWRIIIVKVDDGWFDVKFFKSIESKLF